MAGISAAFRVPKQKIFFHQVYMNVHVIDVNVNSCNVADPFTRKVTLLGTLVPLLVNTKSIISHSHSSNSALRHVDMAEKTC